MVVTCRLLLIEPLNTSSEDSPTTHTLRKRLICSVLCLRVCLDTRVDSYLQRKLLEPGDEVLLTRLIGTRDNRNPVKATDHTQLLVHPRCAIAAGLRYKQEDRDIWEKKWRQREQQKRKGSQQQAGQQPAGAVQQPHSRQTAVQEQKQHQQPSTPAVGVLQGQPSCPNQPNTAQQQPQQQGPPTAPPLQQVQQQPVALLPQQQHQGCVAAQAGAHAPGDQRPNGTVQQSPAGVAAGAGAQAAGGEAADVQVRRSHGHVECDMLYSICGILQWIWHLSMQVTTLQLMQELTMPVGSAGRELPLRSDACICHWREGLTFCL